MNSIMLSQMGMALAGSIGEYATASSTSKLNSQIQAYRNTMSKLSAARSLNAVTVNQVRTQDAMIIADQMIQKQAMVDQGRQEVEAAAAGVTGNSVAMAARDLRASAGRASYAQKRQATQQQAEMRGQKTSIAISAITNQDIQVIPKPSVGSLLLGTTTTMLSIYDSHQPEGSRLLGYNGGSVNDTDRL